MSIATILAAQLPHMINSAHNTLYRHAATGNAAGLASIGGEVVRNALQHITGPLELLVAEIEAPYVHDAVLCMHVLDTAGAPTQIDGNDLTLAQRVLWLAQQLRPTAPAPDIRPVLKLTPCTCVAPIYQCTGCDAAVAVAELHARIAQLESENQELASQVCDLEAEIDNHEDSAADLVGATS